MEGPTTASTCGIFRYSVMSVCCEFTMSRMAKRGNDMRGCAGLFDGDVVSPLPMASVATTKYLLVSSALPGPIRKSSRW
jgi:hypothetical protein